MSRPRHGLTRRETLSLLTSGAAAAACTRDRLGFAVPWVERPVDHVPGEPRWYATSRVEDGFAMGLLVESHEGRPTKIEGNPLHPASLGATGPREQAAVLGLYDPNRGRTIRQGDQPRAFPHLARFLARLPADGRGVRVLMEPTSSPVHADLLARIRDLRPALRVHHAPLLPDPFLALPRMGALRRLLTIDADPIGEGPRWVRQARDFAVTRRPGDMGRVFAVEPSLTLTGARADHRLAVAPSRLPAVLAAAASHILPEAAPLLRRLPPTAREWDFVEIAARDLVAHRGAAAVLVGARQPAWMRGLADLVNQRLEAPIDHVASPIVPLEPLEPLLAALDAGAVETLIVLGGNPAYGHPADLRVPERLRRAGTIVRLGLYEDETSDLADWYVPERHFLERWGDARAADGTISLLQPLIDPLYDGTTDTALLAFLAGVDATDRQLLVERYDALPELLRAGVVPDTAAAPVAPSIDAGAVLAAALAAPPLPSAPIELQIRPSHRVHDGRYANNPWLQELPHFATKQSWGSAALIAPATAARLGLATGDLVAVRGADALVTPVVVAADQAEDTVTMELGYGRRGEEVVGAGIGVDVSPLRRAESPWWAPVALEPRGDRVELAFTQRTFDRHDREIARVTTPHHLATEPPGRDHPPPQMYRRPGQAPDRLGAPHQWGMAVDLSTCIGCQACVVACQAENNVPVVGEVDVRKGRAMYWLRIDRYVDGPHGRGTTWQPMLCQHCENAPCEYVCPTYATVHSPDGLNEMVYNRCIGTRFCSNNCPYKVRRFNWFDWHLDAAYVRTLQFNPEVTVRDRGVMEKCTFCVQRIRTAEIRATTEGRDLRTDEVVTACQAACPTDAIVFGDIHDPGARVTRLHGDERAYDELGELGTAPRVRYLADLRAPAPELDGEGA